MNTYITQPARQAPRLQNTQKSGIANSMGSSWGMGLQGVGFNGNSLAGNGAAAVQNRSGHLSGFAQVIGGGNGQGPIDMSDFPSLSGPRSQPSNISSTNWGNTSNSLRQTSSSQQLNQHQQNSSHLSQSHNLHQPRTPSAESSQNSVDQFLSHRPSVLTERPSAGEEFPPLGVQMGAATSQNAGHGSVVSPNALHSRISTQQLQASTHEGANLSSNSQLSSPSAQTQHTVLNGHGSVPSRVKPYTELTDVEKWTLPGLMAAFEARRIVEAGGQIEDILPPSLQNAVLFGQDLTSLGLDLDSSDSLYHSFAPYPSMNGTISQFDFHERHTVPDFTLPSAYTVTNVPPLSSRLSALSDETLFAVFYQHPRDVLQELAAMELTVRDWRWHKVLRKWLQKDARDTGGVSSLPIVDMAGIAPLGAPPLRLSEHTERGVYVFFDPSNWRRERREFVLDYEQLDHRHGTQAFMGTSNPLPATAPALNIQGTDFPTSLASSNIGMGNQASGPSSQITTS